MLGIMGIDELFVRLIVMKPLKSSNQEILAKSCRAHLHYDVVQEIVSLIMQN